MPIHNNRFPSPHERPNQKVQVHFVSNRLPHPANRPRPYVSWEGAASIQFIERDNVLHDKQRYYHIDLAEIRMSGIHPLNNHYRSIQTDGSASTAQDLLVTMSRNFIVSIHVQECVVRYCCMVYVIDLRPSLLTKFFSSHQVQGFVLSFCWFQWRRCRLACCGHWWFCHVLWYGYRFQ